MIIPIVMAGGTGSRLWPVSRESYPKQFVSFHQQQSSLFQQSLERLSGLEHIAPPIVVCNQAHRFLVAEQLQKMGISDASIILEPLVRNTAPAVALAAINAMEIQEDACMLVLAADHHIDGLDQFHRAIDEGARQARQGKLVTFGLVPDAPKTGYGYIRRGNAAGDSAFQVAEFVEKPDRDTAETYLASGDYYWNSGMFMFLAKDYLGELEKFAPGILETCRKAYDASAVDPDFKRIPEDIFSTCPADSIDYAVMEHTDRAVVVPLAAAWSDLGAWDSIWEKGEKDGEGNVCLGDVCLHDVNNSYIHASSRLVSVVGLTDAVVVETSDAVLVSNRSNAQNVKEIVEQLKRGKRSETDLHPVVRRPWGSYESLVSDDGFQVKRIIVNPGGILSLQLHHHRAEHWTIVRGEAQVTCGEKVFTLRRDESVYIPVETRHRIENPGKEPVVFIEVQCGDYLGEDDIVRFEDKYGRTNQTG